MHSVIAENRSPPRCSKRLRRWPLVGSTLPGFRRSMAGYGASSSVLTSAMWPCTARREPSTWWRPLQLMCPGRTADARAARRPCGIWTASPLSSALTRLAPTRSPWPWLARPPSRYASAETKTRARSPTSTKGGRGSTNSSTPGGGILYSCRRCGSGTGVRNAVWLWKTLQRMTLNLWRTTSIHFIFPLTPRPSTSRWTLAWLRRSSAATNDAYWLSWCSDFLCHWLRLHPPTRPTASTSPHSPQPPPVNPTSCPGAHSPTATVWLPRRECGAVGQPDNTSFAGVRRAAVGWAWGHGRGRRRPGTCEPFGRRPPPAGPGAATGPELRTGWGRPGPPPGCRNIYFRGVGQGNERVQCALLGEVNYFACLYECICGGVARRVPARVF